jgi:predicted dehydrogenase
VADVEHLVLEGVEVEDTVHVLTRHGNVLGSYSLNQYQAPNELTITVVCQQATVRCELHRNRWRWMSGPDTPWQEVVCGQIERDDVFIAQANMFLDALDNRTSPACTLEEAVSTLRCNRAILESAENRRWISIDRG